jgi:hypothetical protein
MDTYKLGVACVSMCASVLACVPGPRGPAGPEGPPGPTGEAPAVKRFACVTESEGRLYTYERADLGDSLAVVSCYVQDGGGTYGRTTFYTASDTKYALGDCLFGYDETGLSRFYLCRQSEDRASAACVYFGGAAEVVTFAASDCTIGS